jgi:hypothetical protein
VPQLEKKRAKRKKRKNIRRVDVLRYTTTLLHYDRSTRLLRGKKREKEKVYLEPGIDDVGGGNDVPVLRQHALHQRVEEGVVGTPLAHSYHHPLGKQAIYIYVYMYICIYVHMYICIYICTYILRSNSTTHTIYYVLTL